MGAFADRRDRCAVIDRVRGMGARAVKSGFSGALTRRPSIKAKTIEICLCKSKTSTGEVEVIAVPREANAEPRQ
jgi:hypothetical protein